MKKKFLYLFLFTAMLATAFSSCKEDDITFGIDPTEDLDRMPMTMFRTVENTNKDDGNDSYHSGTDEEIGNRIHLSWFGIEGAAGYEIRYGMQNGLTDGEESTWANDSLILEDIVVGPDVLEYNVDGLEYGTVYRFAIRVLSPKGEQYNSKWYGHGNGREWAEQAEFTTLQRSEKYNVLGLINVGEKTKESFTVYLVPQYDATEDATNHYSTEYGGNFEVTTDDNGNQIYKVDYIEVSISPSTPGATLPEEMKKIPITQQHIDAGEVHITGLSENSVYVVNAVNADMVTEVYNDPAAKVLVQNRTNVNADAIYNTCTVRTKGDPGDPILIKHEVNPTDSATLADGGVGGIYNAYRLDDIFLSYNSDVTMAEGQVFRLEGDKEYYFATNLSISKGFTLETDPDDLAQGKRAKLYMGGLKKNGTSVNSCNFMLGRNKEAGEADAPIEVEDLIFRHLDVDCPLAQNCAYEDGATGNYFINMYSGGMAVTFNSIQVLDCTFQHMIRGFIRVQGSKVKKFHNLIVDGNVFYNCGYYQNNGNSYCMFAGDGASAESNIYENMVFTNNTIYNSPLNSIFTDNSKDLAWQNYGVQWKFTVENNTFINFNTFASSRYIFSLRYVPAESEFNVHNNLIVLTKDASDPRNLYCSGADIRQINGNGIAYFNVSGNYSAGYEESHLKNDGIFSAGAFSASKNTFGAFPELCTEGEDNLIVRVGETPLLATDLFNAPNPPIKAASGDLPTDNGVVGDIWTNLQYKSTSTVTNHEIYKNNVGDQRWKSSNPRFYYQDLN